MIFRGEFDKLTIAIYGQLLAAEEVSMMLNKQFDMPQQQELPVKKEDDATPMLSPEEEAMLADAFKEHCVLQPHESEVRPEEMTDVEKSHDPAFVDPTKGETLEQLIAKVEAQARTILDVYACSVTSPVPSNFCVSYQNLVIAVKQVPFARATHGSYQKDSACVQSSPSSRRQRPRQIFRRSSQKSA